MLERGFKNAHEVLQFNKQKAIQRGDADLLNTTAKQQKVLEVIERTTKKTLDRYGVSDIHPIGSLHNPFTRIGLSPRTVNALKRYAEQFSTIADLDAATDEELLGIRQVGKKSLREIRDQIAEYKTQNGIQLQ